MLKAVERGFRLSHAVLKYLKQTARLAGEHARAVLGAGRDERKLFQTSNGTVGFAWLLLFSTGAGVAHARAAAAQQLREDVCPLLAATLDLLGAELRQAAGAGVPRRDALTALRSIEFRRIEATSRAIAAFERLAALRCARDVDGLAQLRAALAAASVEADEAALCAKLAAEASPVGSVTPAPSVSNDGGGGGGDGNDDDAPVSPSSSFSISSSSSSSTTSSEPSKVSRSQSALNKLFHTFRGDSSGSIGSSSNGSSFNGLSSSVGSSNKKGSSSMLLQQKQQQQQQPQPPQLQQSIPTQPTMEKPQGVVGVPLEEFMARQRELYPALDVPVWCVLLRDSLARFHAEASEGLFRVSGGQHAQNLYREMLSAPLAFARRAPPRAGTAHYFRLVRRATAVPVLASLFKALLRDSPAPVVPADAYRRIVRPDVVAALTADNFCRLVVDQLAPACHRSLFVFVVGYVRALAAHAAATRMGVDNLAVIFAPCLLRCPSTDPARLLECCELEQRLVRAAFRFLPERLYTALNTDVPCLPDGSPYNGRGFEIVADDPLCAKHHIAPNSDDDDDEVDGIDADVDVDDGTSDATDSQPPSSAASPAPAATASTPAPPEEGERGEEKQKTTDPSQRKRDSSSGGDSEKKKLASATKRANREIARIREASARVRAGLQDGRVSPAHAEEFRAAMIDAARALGCTADTDTSEAQTVDTALDALDAALVSVHTKISQADSAQTAGDIAARAKAARKAFVSLVSSRLDTPEEKEAEDARTVQLQGCGTRLERLLADCDGLTEAAARGDVQRDALMALVSQARPLAALEHALDAFVAQQHVAVPPVPVPEGHKDDSCESLAGMLGVLRYHLAQSRARLDAVVAHIAAAPRPLAPELSAALDTLISSSLEPLP